MRHHFFFSSSQLASKKKFRAYSSEFYPPVCYQLSSARTYSLLRNDPPSRSPSIWLSPLGLYLPYLVRVCAKETTRLPSVICTFCSIHPDPNHVDESCRSYPFRVFLQDIRFRIGFPDFYGGSPNIAATSGSPHSGLDFACRPFGFFLTKDTLPVLLLLS